MVKWELWVLYCTIHGSCVEVSQPIEQEHPPSVFECAMYSQLEMARWTSTHPGYRPTRWTCGKRTLKL
jgi:hypothetical protein